MRPLGTLETLETRRRGRKHFLRITKRVDHVWGQEGQRINRAALIENITSRGNQRDGSRASTTRTPNDGSQGVVVI
jgi:hypothetical protein